MDATLNEKAASSEAALFLLPRADWGMGLAGGGERVLSTARFLIPPPSVAGVGRAGSASRNGVEGWAPHWMGECGLLKADAEHCSRS